MVYVVVSSNCGGSFNEFGCCGDGWIVSVNSLHSMLSIFIPFSLGPSHFFSFCYFGFNFV